MTLLRIVPAKPGDEGAHRVRGTKVIAPDGSELPGVTAITLTATAGDGVWRAVIGCMVQAPEVCVHADVGTYTPLSGFQRFVLRLIGIDYAKVTNLGSTEHEFQAV